MFGVNQALKGMQMYDKKGMQKEIDLSTVINELIIVEAIKKKILHNILFVRLLRSHSWLFR